MEEAPNANERQINAKQTKDAHHGSGCLSRFHIFVYWSGVVTHSHRATADVCAHSIDSNRRYEYFSRFRCDAIKTRTIFFFRFFRVNQTVVTLKIDSLLSFSFCFVVKSIKNTNNACRNSIVLVVRLLDAVQRRQSSLSIGTVCALPLPFAGTDNVFFRD